MVERMGGVLIKSTSCCCLAAVFNCPPPRQSCRWRVQYYTRSLPYEEEWKFELNFRGNSISSSCRHFYSWVTTVLCPTLLSLL
jgi:hypothetical protein